MNRGALIWVCVACAASGMRMQRPSYRRFDSMPTLTDSELQADTLGNVEDSARLARLLLALNAEAAFNPSGPAVLSPKRDLKYVPQCITSVKTDLDVLGEARKDDALELDLSPSEVSITGPASQVDIAAKMVKAYIKDQPPKLQTTVECPKAKLRMMLGPSNRHLKFIQEVTGTELEVDGELIPGNAPCTVTIKGSATKWMRKAEQYLASFIGGDPLVVVNFDCPRQSLGRLIGPRACGMKQIERQTGCQLEVKLDKRLSSHIPARVIAKGLASQIDRCREKVERTIKAGEEYFEQENMDIPREKVGLLIGSGGRNLVQIREKTNCYVIVLDSTDGPDRRDVPAKLVFKGAVSEVEAAKKMVGRILARGDAPDVNVTFEIPNNRVLPLLGPRGLTKKRLGESLGVRINLEKGSDGVDIKPGFHSINDDAIGTAKVIVRGKEEYIQEATQAVKDFIATGISEVLLEVPKEQLGRLNGPSAGIHIANLKSELGCHIETFCEGDWDPDLCKVVIQGPNAKVEAAEKRFRRYLKTASEDLRQKVIRIPKSSITKLIGQGGNHIQSITDWTDCDVQIDREHRFSWYTHQLSKELVPQSLTKSG